MAYQPHKQMLRPDVVVTQSLRLQQAVSQQMLRARIEGQSCWGIGDDLSLPASSDLVPHIAGSDVESEQGLHDWALASFNKGKEEMLGTNGAVLKPLRTLAHERYRAPSLISERIEHAITPAAVQVNQPGQSVMRHPLMAHRHGAGDQVGAGRNPKSVRFFNHAEHASPMKVVEMQRRLARCRLVFNKRRGAGRNARCQYRGIVAEDDPLYPARELFFKYDGSGFYMSRDGVEQDYRRFAVPKELEKAWLEELTDKKLNGLREPGNWLSVHFLCHHNDTRHLHAVMHAEPLGAFFWQRCSYLELLLDYAKLCLGSYPVNDIRAAVESVLTQARYLATSAPDRKLRTRVDVLTEAAVAFRSAL